MTSYYLLLMFLALSVGGCYGYVRMCYYTNWAQYRGFKPDKIDPFVCTHIVYAFAKLQGTNILDIEWNDPTIQAGVIGLKNTNPSLKVILAIGGWNADNTQYVNLVANDTAMQAFADNAITYLRQRGFDGLDLDWEYPANLDRRGTAADRVQFTRWLQILQNNFIAESAATNQPRLLLTAAVAASMPTANNYYEVAKIGNYLDILNLMTYDFHGSWDGRTLGVQHHSPLYPEGNSSVIGWIAAGFPANKIAMGMGAYGRSYTLNAQPTGNGIGASPSGYSQYNYKVICGKLNAGYQLIQLTNQGVVAALGQKFGQWEWIGFDNPSSFALKANYIRVNGLAGSMVWALDQDDENNTCGGGNYPLLTTLQQQLPAGADSTQSSTVYVPPSTSTSTSTTTTTTTYRPPTTSYYVPPTTNPYTTPRVPQCGMVWPVPSRCPARNERIPWEDNVYYLVCQANLFAVKCRCNGNMFYNPCRGTCDFRSNYFSCSLMYGKK
ncbi:chitotriosidase-1 isoform X2 [Patella vulgata]|uniref:chitotriosidase-1 isoform X2 n=1 Tax=Patella vulgata TaxID=6465 RepID=UPI00217F6AFC|nr:chitotriosidase-1 isoform X2 [Patella vulgata]